MGIVIEDYTPESAPNPFIDDIKALADAGEGKAGKFVVKTDEAKKSKFKISRAANELGYTAKHKSAVENEDGTTELVVILGAKQKARRGQKPDETVEGDTAEVAESAAKR